MTLLYILTNNLFLEKLNFKVENFHLNIDVEKHQNLCYAWFLDHFSRGMWMEKTQTDSVFNMADKGNVYVADTSNLAIIKIEVDSDCIY